MLTHANYGDEVKIETEKDDVRKTVRTAIAGRLYGYAAEMAGNVCLKL